jgi:replication factor C large subunit
LARRSGGDLRGAINDLQALANIGKVIDTLDDVDDRKKTDSMLNALMLVFRSKKAENVLGAFDNVDADLNEALMWVDENLPKEYAGADLRRAYNWLSRADVFKGRIRRWQHWRFLVYINTLLTAGIATAKEQKSSGFVSYKQSGRILKLWQAKMKNAKRWAIAQKVAEYNHTSSKKAYRDMLPYLQVIFRNGSGEEIAKDLGFDEDEVAWLAR